MWPAQGAAARRAARAFGNEACKWKKDICAQHSFWAKQGCAACKKAHVAVFGLGGVGGYAAEALARAGVGALSLFDADVFSPSNLNRQLCAAQSTLGQPKAQVFAAHIAAIDPAVRVQAHRVFYLPETAQAWPLGAYDYVLDAVDTVAAKLELAVRAYAAGCLISAMGCGNKLDSHRLCRDRYFCPRTQTRWPRAAA